MNSRTEGLLFESRIWTRRLQVFVAVLLTRDADGRLKHLLERRPFGELFLGFPADFVRNDQETEQQIAYFLAHPYVRSVERCRLYDKSFHHSHPATGEPLRWGDNQERAGLHLLYFETELDNILPAFANQWFPVMETKGEYEEYGIHIDVTVECMLDASGFKRPLAPLYGSHQQLVAA